MLSDIGVTESNMLIVSAERDSSTVWSLIQPFELLLNTKSDSVKLILDEIALPATFGAAVKGAERMSVVFKSATLPVTDASVYAVVADKESLVESLSRLVLENIPSEEPLIVDFMFILLLLDSPELSVVVVVLATSFSLLEIDISLVKSRAGFEMAELSVASAVDAGVLTASDAMVSVMPIDNVSASLVKAAAKVVIAFKLAENDGTAVVSWRSAEVVEGEVSCAITIAAAVVAISVVAIFAAVSSAAASVEAIVKALTVVSGAAGVATDAAEGPAV